MVSLTSYNDYINGIYTNPLDYLIHIEYNNNTKEYEMVRVKKISATDFIIINDGERLYILDSVNSLSISVKNQYKKF